MTPFPSIFKARCLSKSWLARLSPIAAKGNEAKKALAISFQKQVSERAKAWETSSPILMVGKERDLIAYDQGSHKWRKMPSLSFLPEMILDLNLQIEGALLYASSDASTTSYDQMYLANILSSTWKKLPPPAITKGELVCRPMLVVTDKCLEAYKVIAFCILRGPTDRYLFQIYESKSDSWSSKKISDGGQRFDEICRISVSSAYLKGVMYLMGGAGPLNLWAINVEEGTLETRHLSFNGDVYGYEHDLLVYKADLLMIVTDDYFHEPFLSYRVMKIDVGSSRLVQLVQGPPAALAAFISESINNIPVTDSRFIYFGLREDSSRILFYNRFLDGWSCLFVPPLSTSGRKYKWIASVFQPGLNPFAVV